MRRAKMDRPFIKFSVFLLLIATTTATIPTNGDGNYSSSNGVTKSRMITRMGGAAPPPPTVSGTTPQMGTTPPPPPRMGGATPPPRMGGAPPPPPTLGKAAPPPPRMGGGPPPPPTMGREAPPPPRMGGAPPPTPTMGREAPPPPIMGEAPQSPPTMDGAAPPPPRMGGTAPILPLLPIEQEFLDAHNEARYHAGLPLLKWDSKVAAYAQWYAKSHIKDCKLEHSTGPFGENIFWGEGRTWTPKMAVKDWVKEHRYYNKLYHQCQYGQLCGHYTQIIWRDTEKVGCGMVLCGPGDTYIVCSYDPPGNYKGKKPFEKHNPAMYNQKERMQRISWIPNI